MLKQVFLVRHAQSEEDVKPSMHNSVSDRRISITAIGKRQTLETVEILSPKISTYQRVKIITSPSNRAEQTMSSFCSSFPLIDFDLMIESRIRNLNWGNVDESTIKEVEKERYRVGVLHFQFPQGDYTPDFVRDIECFVEELKEEGKSENYPECAIVFTHGFALRIIVKAFLAVSDEEFRFFANPPNCYVAILDNVDSGKFVLREPLPKINFHV